MIIGFFSVMHDTGTDFEKQKEQLESTATNKKT